MLKEPKTLGEVSVRTSNTLLSCVSLSVWCWKPFACFWCCRARQPKRGNRSIGRRASCVSRIPLGCAAAGISPCVKRLGLTRD